MRTKQIVVTNGLFLTALALFYIMTIVFEVTEPQLFFGLGVIILIGAILDLFKGNWAKSLIPIFEQVAIYEKKKMGNEWRKQRKTSFIGSFLLSAMMFLQFYLFRESTDAVFQVDLILPVLFIFLLIIATINIRLLIHINKIDRANSTLELEGYNRKSNLIGIVLGVSIAFVMFIFIIFYVMITG